MYAKGLKPDSKQGIFYTSGFPLSKFSHRRHEAKRTYKITKHKEIESERAVVKGAERRLNDESTRGGAAQEQSRFEVHAVGMR